MATLMRETYYGRHEPAWMAPIREPAPYFDEAPYEGFRESHQYPLHDESYFAPYHALSPFSESLSRVPRTSSSIPAFSHYDESPFVEPLPPRGGSLRSSSAIPAYAYPGRPFPDAYSRGALLNRPIRSTSSVPAYELHSHNQPSNRPTRSTSAVPAYELHTNSPTSNRPTLSSSAIPVYNLGEPRLESRSKKVAPEIELRVPMCCSKCEAKTKDTLRKLPGVTEVKTDRRSSKVTVTGKVDPQVVLKQIQKSKKKADFWTKQIYSQAFINFIQSKTGQAQPEDEITSSYHQHVPPDEVRGHHAYEESEHLSSYEEHPGYSERNGHESYERMERSRSHTILEEDDNIEMQRGYYSHHSYDPRADMSPYGGSFSYGHLEELHGNRDDRAARFENHGPATYYEHFEPSYRDTHLERESGPMYEEFGSSYRPSQGYGPSGVSNPSYMKRISSGY